MLKLVCQNEFVPSAGADVGMSLAETLELLVNEHSSLLFGIQFTGSLS